MVNGWAFDVDLAFCKGSIREKPGRPQSDRFYKRNWPLLNGLYLAQIHLDALG
jgi:hypothetical protein